MLARGWPSPRAWQLLQQLVEPVAQALLVLTQIAHLVLALLPALTVAPHVLTLLERLVAQLLLLADHVTEFVERRHHVVVAVVTPEAPGRAICRFSSIDCS